MAEKRNSGVAARAKPKTQQVPAPPKMPHRQESHLSSSGPDRTGGGRTPGGRRGSRPYEFDSCISTEEAFFALAEEHKFARPSDNDGGGGSNPQEDGTPKAATLLEQYQRQASTHIVQHQKSGSNGFNPGS